MILKLSIIKKYFTFDAIENAHKHTKKKYITYYFEALFINIWFNGGFQLFQIDFNLNIFYLCEKLSYFIYES
ncbi:hypothetical protein CAPN004_09360 [Capnocytophaga cynodegmi]|nr:hypothetical protein CAPN004_09360 [Capnocytophaga cynodegmi]